MVDHQISPKFSQEIQRRLNVAQSNVEQSRQAMNVVMVNLEERETKFDQIADQLLNEVLRPALQTFAGYFDNAQLKDGMLGYSVCCQLLHSIRFPAVAHIEFRLTHNETIEGLTIQYDAHILPVFIRFDRSDALDLSMSEIDLEAVREWAEQRVLGFMDSYLQIETHEQYQRENVALDPVCGMRVTKPTGLAHVHEGQTYYFCAQRCLDRFVKDPVDFVHSAGN